MKALNPKDFELIKGTFECKGCVFDNNGKCMIGIGTEYERMDFGECWAYEVLYDKEFPDPDEPIYLILKEK